MLATRPPEHEKQEPKSSPSRARVLADSRQTRTVNRAGLNAGGLANRPANATLGTPADVRAPASFGLRHVRAVVRAVVPPTSTGYWGACGAASIASVHCAA